MRLHPAKRFPLRIRNFGIVSAQGKQSLAVIIVIVIVIVVDILVSLARPT